MSTSRLGAVTPNVFGGDLPEIMAEAPTMRPKSVATGEACRGSNTLCHDVTNSCAVKSSPFDHLASGRRWKVYWVPVASTDQEEATAGTTSPVAVSRVSPS